MIAQIPLLKINIHPRTISPLYVLKVSNHFLIRNSNHVVMKPRTISTYPNTELVFEQITCSSKKFKLIGLFDRE